MSDLKIEVGTFYKARNGSKVRIYATDVEGEDPIHGAMGKDEWWHLRSWCKKGTYHENGREDPFDIVSEWVEPKPRLYAYLQQDVISDLWKVQFWTHISVTENDSLIRAPHLDFPEVQGE